MVAGTGGSQPDCNRRGNDRADSHRPLQWTPMKGLGDHRSLKPRASSPPRPTGGPLRRKEASDSGTMWQDQQGHSRVNLWGVQSDRVDCSVVWPTSEGR